MSPFAARCTKSMTARLPEGAMGDSLFKRRANSEEVEPPKAAKDDEGGPAIWASVFVVAYSSFLVGVALAQLNALTGDASAKGSLSLTTTEVSACTAALRGSAR